MSLTLAIILFLLVVTTWLFAMYIAWRYERGVALGIIRKAPFIVRWERGIRLTRRGWYGATMQAKNILHWGNRKASDAIVAIFPNAAGAFTKPDAMTGLEHGPSSFFLKSISTKSPKKRLSRSKKML